MNGEEPFTWTTVETDILIPVVEPIFKDQGSSIGVVVQ